MFVAEAQRVTQPRPNEMKNFVVEDAGEIAAPEQFLVDHDTAAVEEGGSVHAGIFLGDADQELASSFRQAPPGQDSQFGAKIRQAGKQRVHLLALIGREWPGCSFFRHRGEKALWGSPPWAAPARGRPWPLFFSGPLKPARGPARAQGG